MKDNQEVGSLSDASGYGHLTNPIVESCRTDFDPMSSLAQLSVTPLCENGGC